MPGSAIVDQHGRPFPVEQAPRPKSRVRVIRLQPPGQQFKATTTQPYEAAAMDRIRGGWLPGNASADSDLLPNLPLIRARSRDTARNGLGAGVIRTLVDHIIGHRGLVPQSKLDPELFGGDAERARRAERQIEAAIKAWGRKVDVAR